MARVTVVNRFVKGFCVAVGLAMVAGTVSYAAGTRIIRIQDQCDPETFDAVFGDGTCVSSHQGVTHHTATDATNANSTNRAVFGPLPNTPRSRPRMAKYATAPKSHDAPIAYPATRRSGGRRQART